MGKQTLIQKIRKAIFTENARHSEEIRAAGVDLTLGLSQEKMVLNILQAIGKGLEPPKPLLQINPKSDSPGRIKVMSQPSVSPRRTPAEGSRPASK
jgi:hypothetical protein